MIERIYAILDKSDKLKLRSLLLTDAEINSEKKCIITVGDWVKIMRDRKAISRRLTNCIAPEWGSVRIQYECLNDIYKSDIMNLRNAGRKSWIEFDNLRRKYFEEIGFKYDDWRDFED